VSGRAKSEKRRTDHVLSVRLDDETAAEVRWAAAESGTSASDLARRGLKPVLAVIRADWYERHAREEDWEDVPAEVQAGTPRRLDSSFGVRLSYEQVLEVAGAANACGVTISAYLREAGLALAAAQRAGGTARCAHVSGAPVTALECGICGPLPVELAVRAPGSVS
jgi:hypothetical protein